MALDQNHEQCNAVVKGKRGVTDLFLKDEALRRWLIAQPIIVDLLKGFHKEIGFCEDKFNWLHHEESCSYKERFKEELNGLVQAFEHVENPFADSSRKLVTLCSRQVSDAEGIQQLQNLKKDGIQKFKFFVTSRILENEDFTKPITKVAIDLLRKTRKKTNKSREMIKCDTSLLQKVFISSYVRGKDALRMFFKHETSAYPFALSSNGNLRTTAKSALLPILESYGFSQSSAPTCDVYVIDGPVLLQMLKPRGSVTTFEEYISKTIIPFVINKAAIYKRVDIVFDVYLRNSIKASIRRSKRGSGQQVAVTTSTQILQNWSEFLRNDKNKTALFALVQKHVVTAVDPHLATVVVTSFDTVLSNDTFDLSDISHAIVRKQTLACFFMSNMLNRNQ